MPSVSSKQRRFMAAAAHNKDFARKAGIKQSVAREFAEADKEKDNKKAKRFSEIIKDATVSSVHVPSAGGDKKKKKKPNVPLSMGTKPAIAKLFSDIVRDPSVLRLSSNTRRLVRHDDKTMKSPFNVNTTALGGLRPDQHPRFLSALTDSDTLERREIALSSLTALQNRVDPEKVANLRGMYHRLGNLPVVVRFAGNNYIADGHHRLAAQWLDGHDTAVVRYKDISQFSNAMKRDEIGALNVTKVDPDKRLVFGWASVVEKDGKLVVDKQGDMIPPSELENAVYEFVLSSRENDDMHRRPKTGRLVESMVFTKEKQEALGIDLGKVGWFAGFKIDDDELWAAHKRGERPEFSIGGAAIPVHLADTDPKVYDGTCRQAPNVSVAPPNVNVNVSPPNITVTMPGLQSTKKKVQTSRDADGNLTAVIDDDQDG